METYGPTVLESGDSVRFDSLMPHGFVSLGDEEASMFSVSVSDNERTRKMMEEPSGEPEGSGVNVEEN